MDHSRRFTSAPTIPHRQRVHRIHNLPQNPIGRPAIPCRPQRLSRITLEEALKCARMLDTFSQLPMSPYDDARTEHAPYGVDRHMIILKHIQVAVGRTRGVSDGEEGIFAEAARECVIELLRYVERYKEREVVSKAGEEEEATRREAREIARRNRAGSWALWMLRGIWSVPSCIFGVVGGICGAILGVPASLRRILGFGR
jgi:hypothetical protein